MRRIACLIALCAAPVPAGAAPPAAADICAHAPPLAEPWTSWSQSGDAIAGGDVVSAPRLILGKPVLAGLRPVSQVQFPAKPAATKMKSYGGLFTLALKDPARIGIALSGPAWVDVVNGRKAVGSVDHGHGPDCSGIRKILWFDLPPGLHMIQVANAPSREIRIMAADASANQPRPPVREAPF